VKELLKNLDPVMKGLVDKKKNAVCVAIPEQNIELAKSFSNIDATSVVLTKDLNPVDILSHKYLLIVNPDVSLKILEQRLNKRGKIDTSLTNKNVEAKSATKKTEKKEKVAVDNKE
jgi:ribose 1,5-bisphosphokinase PhnN